MLIVDPPGGRPPAHEVGLVLSGFDCDGDGHNELYGWNGVAGYFERYPIKVPAGALVRVYLLNMVADDPVGSFHLHGLVRGGLISRAPPPQPAHPAVRIDLDAFDPP